jgi:hypothetical protein
VENDGGDGATRPGTKGRAGLPMPPTCRMSKRARVGGGAAKIHALSPEWNTLPISTQRNALVAESMPKSDTPRPSTCLRNQSGRKAIFLSGQVTGSVDTDGDEHPALIAMYLLDKRVKAMFHTMYP